MKYIYFLCFLIVESILFFSISCEQKRIIYENACTWKEEKNTSGSGKCRFSQINPGNDVFVDASTHSNKRPCLPLDNLQFGSQFRLFLNGIISSGDPFLPHVLFQFKMEYVEIAKSVAVIKYLHPLWNAPFVLNGTINFWHIGDELFAQSSGALYIEGYGVVSSVSTLSRSPEKADSCNVFSVNMAFGSSYNGNMFTTNYFTIEQIQIE